MDVATVRGVTADEAIRLAAGLERDSEHPIAKAIVKSAADRKLTVPASADFEYVTGRGVNATIEGRQLAGGGPNLLASLNVTPDAPSSSRPTRNSSGARSLRPRGVSRTRHHAGPDGVIDAADNFIRKAERTLEAVRQELPECCRDHTTHAMNAVKKRSHVQST